MESTTYPRPRRCNNDSVDRVLGDFVGGSTRGVGTMIKFLAYIFGTDEDYVKMFLGSWLFVVFLYGAALVIEGWR